METKKGQSLIEVVFSVGVVVLVITGVVVLIVATVGAKTAAFQRKKATDMAEAAIEKLVDKKRNDTENFWKLTNITDPQNLSGFDGYTYTVGYTNITTAMNNKCGIGITDCASGSITVSWGVGKSLVVNRFFSRKN